MYLGELLLYYQSSNNLPQSAQTLDFIFNCALYRSTLPVALLVVYLSPSHYFFVALVSLGPRVALLVVDLFPFQSFILCVAQHLELLCSSLTCLHLNFSSFVLLNTSSCSACCRPVSISIFLALVCSTHWVALLVVDLS